MRSEVWWQFGTYKTVRTESGPDCLMCAECIDCLICVEQHMRQALKHAEQALAVAVPKIEDDDALRGLVAIRHK